MLALFISFTDDHLGAGTILGVCAFTSREMCKTG